VRQKAEKLSRLGQIDVATAGKEETGNAVNTQRLAKGAPVEVIESKIATSERTAESL